MKGVRKRIRGSVWALRGITQRVDWLHCSCCGLLSYTHERLSARFTANYRQTSSWIRSRASRQDCRELGLAEKEEHRRFFKVTLRVSLERNGCLFDCRLLDTLFPVLISTPSKTLRALVFQKITSDLRNSNATTKNHRLNRSFQKTLFELVTSDRSSPKAIWAVRITKELWRRQLWTDEKAVEIRIEAELADN